MVQILANGDIVPDNDPRATGASQRNSVQQGTPRMGTVDHNADQAQHMRQPMRHAPGSSMLDSFNSQLAGLGVPTWHLGPYDVQPITSFAFLVSLLLFGFPGLLFSLLLFFIVKYSQSGLGSGRALRMPRFLQHLGFGSDGNGRQVPGGQNQGLAGGGRGPAGAWGAVGTGGAAGGGGGAHSWGSGNRLGSS